MKKPAKDLRVGDRVSYLAPYPIVVITAIRPYKGPLKCVEFLIDTAPGMGFSMCYGDEWEVIE